MAMDTTRCAVNHTTKIYPIMVDLIAIWNRRQVLIHDNLIWHNCERYNYHYPLGNLTMVNLYNTTKMMWVKLRGLYPIIEQRTNGMVQIQRALLVMETFNTRKFVHYKG